MGGADHTASKPTEIDTAANRLVVKWNMAEQFGRVLWALLTPFFALSPRVFWGWRVALLRCFGATIGAHVHIYPSVRIAIPWNISIGDFCAVGDRATLYSLGRITLGNSATVSQNAHLCAGTHDHRDPTMPLLKQPITIGDGVWVCADAFIGPNVTVGAFAIVGARAVVVKDVPTAQIVAGNPAFQIGVRELRPVETMPLGGEPGASPTQNSSQ